MEFEEKKIPKQELWVEENFRGISKQSYRITESLFSGQSQFQSVDVVDSAGHGKILLNDGLMMLSERDEFVYHDMISHLPLYTHPNPEKVLVIGGGDGGTAREVLRHPSVQSCVMVEIDKMVVEACRKHIQQTAVVFDNPKLQLKIEDAVKYVAETQEKFDVILVDSTDPIGPAQPLFGPEFYQNVYNCLSEDGIVVSQGESPFYQQDTQKSLLKVLGQFFSIVGLYNFSNLTYPGGLWSFTFASKKLHPVHDFQQDRYEKESLEFNYYNRDVHKACLALPEFMKKNLGPYLKGL